MKNVTITLNEDIAHRARVEAAREGKSLSKFVSGLVEARIGRDMTQLEALEKLKALPLRELTGGSGKAPSRTELYDERADQLFRRHERPVVPEGRKKQRKA